MTQINKVLRFIHNKKTGMIGFKRGNNFTFKCKNRKDFKFGLKCMMIPPSESIVLLQKGGKKREIRL